MHSRLGDRLLYIRSAERRPMSKELSSFQLRNVPLLSRVGADRADALRTDIDAAVAGWADALLLRVDPPQSGADRRRPGGARQGRRARATSRPTTRCFWAG